MILGNIPDELRRLPQWVCRRGKVPYNPRTGSRAKAGKADTWVTFEEAVQAADRYDGIGFEFNNNGLVGIDLDTVRDPVTGWIDPLAAEIIEKCNSYTEISPSGYGFHIIARASDLQLNWNKHVLPANQIMRLDVDPKTGEVRQDKGENPQYKHPEIEMYIEGRYFTVTGDVFDGRGVIKDATSAAKELQQRFVNKPTEGGAALSWDSVIGAADSRNDYLSDGLKHDAKLRELWYGGRPNGNESADDQALMNKLAYWLNCDRSQMKAAFLSSPHFASKDDAHQRKAAERADYLDRTIERAVKDCKDTAAASDARYKDRKLKEDFGAEQKNSPSLSVISALELQQKDLPEIQFIVEGLLPQGLALLASPPKYGKSWLVLSLCLASAIGDLFLGHKTIECGCLYLALEDSERRLKKRMNKLLGDRKAPDNFHFATSAHDLDNGLIEELDDFINKHSGTKLIVIDTLQKVRSVGNGKDVYGKDYRDIGRLKQFADKYNLCLLLVHHLRKMQAAGDPFERISGTNGIMGGADTTMVLTREKRNAEDTLLSVTGRDVNSTDTYITFDKSTCAWSVKGDADWLAEQRARLEYENSPVVRTIKKLLENPEKRWDGTANEMLEAGRFITKSYIAQTAQKLGYEIRALERPLLERDNIIHSTTGNGTGGKKHSFWYGVTVERGDTWEELTDCDNPFFSTRC